MRTLFLLLILLFAVKSSLAQPAIEKEIRQLDEMEAQVNHQWPYGNA